MKKPRTSIKSPALSKDTLEQIVIASAQMRVERLNELRFDMGLTLVRTGTDNDTEFWAAGAKPSSSHFINGEHFNLYKG